MIRLRKESFGYLGIDPFDRQPMLVDYESISQSDADSFVLVKPKLLSGCSPFESPLYLTCFVTLSCNKLCSFCCYSDIVHYNGDTMPYDIADRIIYLAEDYALLAVDILGGEPIHNPSWPVTKYLAESLLAKSVCVSLTTNGLCISQFANSVLNLHSYSPLFILKLSINPSDLSRFYTELEKTIRILNEYGPIHLNTVALSKNIDDYSSIHDFINFLNAKLDRWTILFPRGQNLNQLNLLQFNMLVSKLQQKFPETTIIADDIFPRPFSRKSDRKGLEFLLGCGVGLRNFAVLPNGESFLCRNLVLWPKYRIGNVQNNALQLWRNAVNLGSSVRNIIPSWCHCDCELYDQCQPCPADILSNCIPLCPKMI